MAEVENNTDAAPEGPVTKTKNTDAAPAGPVTKTKKKLVVKPSAVMHMIQARADADHDGKVTQSELHEFFSHADLNEALVRQYKKLLIIQAIAAFLIIIVLATVTGLAVQLLKESHVKDNTFIDLDGNPVQCASNELEVALDGTLLGKDQDKTKIRTFKAPSVSHPLNSKVPDRYLQRLVEFTAEVDGQLQYVKVQSFRRVIDTTYECGSYVLLTTNLGEFKLDTTHLWHNGGKVEVVGSFTQGRKLSAVNLVAFYDDVEDLEFECTLAWQEQEEVVAKPSMPELPMSFISVNHYPCTAILNNMPRDVCMSTVGANARQTKPGAVTGGDSILQVDHILVTETEKIVVSYFPNHPLQKKVTHFNDTKSTEGFKHEYQLYVKSPVKFHCDQKEHKDLFTLDLQELHYLGVGVHDNVPVRKWAASLLGNITVIPKIPQDFKDDMGVSDHSYLEFWDTDDDKHYPYYAGMMDSDKTSRFTKSYYKSVKAGLSATEVQDWLSTELQGSYNQGACRKSREILKMSDGSYAKIPIIVGATTEINADVQFYLDQMSSSASVPPAFSYQDPSYEGYWALAAAHGHEPQTKSKFKSSSDDAILFDLMYEQCEHAPADVYDTCRRNVNVTYLQSKTFVSSNQTSGRRRLFSRRLDTPERTYPDCDQDTSGWTKRKSKNRWRWRVTTSDTTSCVSGCDTLGAVYPTPSVPHTAEVDADGITFELKRAEEMEITTIPAYTTTTRTTTKCYRYIESQYKVTYSGWSMWIPYDTSDYATLWSRYTDEDESIPAEVKTVHTSLVALKAQGESALMKASSFSQTVAASGSLSMVTEDGETSVTGSLSIEFSAGRKWCQSYYFAGGKFSAAVYVGGGTKISTDDISIDIYGGLRGDIGAYGSWYGGCKCDDDFSGCPAIVGGSIDGKVYIKAYNIGCNKRPKMDMGAKLSISISVGGVFDFSFNKDWVFINGVNVGPKWNC